MMLVWFYLTSFVLLVGAELNAVLDNAVDPEGQAERRRRTNEEGQSRDGARPHGGRHAQAPTAGDARTLRARGGRTSSGLGRAIIVLGIFAISVAAARLFGRSRW
jgi:hypothetical protein